ncbi:MAG: hypothetical protein L6Q95_00165 [Planctomycetes bacterium]|nr:hypothetical protein [Planctomycetota bacterium]
MRTSLLLALLLLPAAGGEPDPARRAVAWLEREVGKLVDSEGTPRKPFTYAITGLVYLMDGGTRTGPDRVRAIREYLVRWIDALGKRLLDPDALPGAHGVADSRKVCQYTWPLAAAALFFGELELRGIEARQAHGTLERILDLLVAAQDANGGWGHGGYPSTLLASSSCVATALGLCGAIEGHERAEPIRRAREYYRAARLPNGSFPYDPGQRQSGFAETNVGRTAGALFAWHALGMERDDAFEGSARYLMENLNLVCEGHGSPCLNMFFGGLSCRMLGAEEWKRFKETYFVRIADAQEEGGVLRCVCEGKAFGVTCDSKDPFGGIAVFADQQAAYTTALHAFVLLLDRGELRILDRRRPGAPITGKRK